MTRSRWGSILGILILLFLGWASFRLMNPGHLEYEMQGFKEWMWEYRSLDLLAQMAVVFAGALGIAAILPVENEDE
jgi:hypothetical protein